MSARTCSRWRMPMALVLAGLSCPLGVRAQSKSGGVSFHVSPAVLRDGGGSYHLGGRWEGAVERKTGTTLSLEYPHETWWEADGKGTIAQKGVTSEPWVSAHVTGGMRVDLLKQRPCTPDCPPPDLDAGYLSGGVTASLEVGAQAAEVDGGVGLAGLYRHFNQDGLWPFVPSVRAALELARPLRSEKLAAEGAAKESRARAEVELLWSYRFDREWMPPFLRPTRLDVDLLGFRQGGTNNAFLNRDGVFRAVDLGYELTGTVPWIRQVYVRWTGGERVTSDGNQKAWMLGISLGSH